MVQGAPLPRRHSERSAIASVRLVSRESRRSLPSAVGCLPFVPGSNQNRCERCRTHAHVDIRVRSVTPGRELPMTKRLFSIVAVLLVVLPAIRSIPAQSTVAAFTHFNVLPMTSDTVLRDQTVLVVDGKIIAPTRSWRLGACG